MNFDDILNKQIDTNYKYKVQEIPREPKFYPNDLAYANILMTAIKPAEKKSKIQRVYEDDTWIIDMIDGKVRVSYFEDCHYIDEITITKEQFK